MSCRCAMEGSCILVFRFFIALQVAAVTLPAIAAAPPASGLQSPTPATSPPPPLPGSQAAAIRGRAEQFTQSLLGLQGRYRQASPAEKDALAAELASLATQRRQALASLIETHPAEVLKLAIPADIRAGLPADVRSQIESHVELQGELTIVVEDYKDRARVRHELHANGRRYNLHFGGHAPQLLSGTRVRVKALQLGSELALESGAGTGGSTFMEITAPALTNTFGNFQTAVLLVNFQDNASQPYSASHAWNMVLGTGTNSANDFFREASFQQTSLSGNVYGWYTLPIMATCDHYQIASAAKSAAAGSGVDLAGYQRLVYVFPANTACAWSGKGTVGGNPASTWINGSLNNALAVTHELGHNFGLYHSHAQECGAATIASTCQNQEYGDWLDAMGNSNVGHFNAFQKERLGWLNHGASPPIITVLSGGSFSLEAYETAGSGAKALKILKGTDPVTGQKSWYYVEYRRALGFDAFLSGNAAMLNGVVLHSGRDGQADSSNLLDATPASYPYNYQDWADAALTTGRSFTDLATGLTISTTSAGGTAAGVSISYGTATCVHVAPSLALSPLQGPTVAPGTPVAYTVTVTNNDPAACNPTQFNLTGTVPGGWTGSLGTSTLSLAAGAKGSTNLTVASASEATAGIYNLSVAVGGGPVATATYMVGSTAPAPANQPPVAANDSAATIRNVPVRVSVLANDRDPEGQALRVVSATRPSRGSATVNADGTITYVPQNNFKGTDSFGYTVSDGSQTASATVSVQVRLR